MKTRVLVVEDEPQVREFMDEALRLLGCEVAVTSEAANALVRMERESYDVVLTDHRMPGMSGLDLVRVLRGQAFAGRIVVVSGDLSAGERAEYEALRVDGIGAKPLGLAELRRLLSGDAALAARGR